MEITYHKKSDLLYICLDPTAKEVVCQDLTPEIVLELGPSDHVVGLEIQNASKRVNLANLPPVKYAEVA